MSKSRNMGRRSHHQQDAELRMDEPGLTASELKGQAARATQHPAQSTKASGEEPERRHSRRGA